MINYIPTIKLEYLPNTLVDKLNKCFGDVRNHTLSLLSDSERYNWPVNAHLSVEAELTDFIRFHGFTGDEITIV